MSNKFLGVGKGSSSLTDGTADLNINALTISGLDSSQPLKTNAVRQLVSEKLSISDINGLQGTLNEAASKEYVDDAVNKDFSGLRGDTAKVNLLTDTTQPIYGTIEKYTASSTILAGQPVRTFYGSNGEVQVNAIGALPTDLHQILGINLNNVLAGETANILVNGYCTARFIAPTVPATNISLNNTTNGTTQAMTNLIEFTDSGGGGSNYNSNENYSITFDAGPDRTINYTINSLGFEHTTTRLYDRMGVQTSTDGITFTNLYDSGYHRTNNDNPPYGDYYYQNNTRTSDTIGTVFPDSVNFITSNGGSLTKTTNARYVKFFFQSDSSQTDTGWNISLVPNISYSGIPIVVGATVYLDNTNFSRLTLTDTSQLPVGYTAYTDAANSSVFCKINVAQHS